MKRFCIAVCLLVLLASTFASAEDSKVFRLGFIGTDTSHVPAFTSLFNDPNAEGLYQKFQVVAAYKGGMIDNQFSWSHIDKYYDAVAPKGVKLYSSIEEMLPNVDGILLESVDGRPHLEEARLVIEAGKPMFVDKPMAGNLWEVCELFRLAEEHNVPIFSASSLRYSADMQRVRNEKPDGETLGVDAWSPCELNEHHPDFYWYGIHGVETLFTMMGGCGCVSVSRTAAKDFDVAVGLWNDGRIGTFRGIRSGDANYSAVVFGSKKIETTGQYDGYKPLCDQICVFFDTGKSPVDSRETLEILAFMSAADASKKLNGAHVTLESVLAQAKALEVKTFTLKLADDGSITLDGEAVTDEELTQTLTFPAGKDATTLYYRVILEKAPKATHERALELTKKLGDAILVRYIY